jgi:hypothetical protein
MREIEGLLKRYVDVACMFTCNPMILGQALDIQILPTRTRKAK